jgi:hypothetical protein
MPAGGVGVCYRIDANDQIVSVDDEWQRIADKISVSHVRADQVTGRVLWDFISDSTTRHIYQRIVSRVRAGRTARFTLRCDTPSLRRLLRMTIRSDETGVVEFRTEPLEIVERAPVLLWSDEAARSDELIRACGWCKRVHIDSDDWVEAEVAVEQLQLFERSALPHVTHGLCDQCLETMEKTIEGLE